MRVYLIALMVLLLEIVDFGEAYKRPFKFHRPKPWHRARYRSYSTRPSKYYRAKPSKSSSYAPTYSYAPLYEEYMPDDKPYTIVIQLPKQNEKYNSHLYQRNYDRDSIHDYVREDEYIEDDEDDDARIFRVGRKNFRIKFVKGLSPKLHIKISRADNEPDIEIVDKSNITTTIQPFTPEVGYSNVLEKVENEGWIPSNPPPTITANQNL